MENENPCCAARILPGHSVVGYVWSSSPGGDLPLVSLGGAADGTRPVPGSRCLRLAGTRASGAAGGSLTLVDGLMDHSDARRTRPDGGAVGMSTRFSKAPLCWTLRWKSPGSRDVRHTAS